MLILVAWRNLWRNRTRSLLILLSVAVGIWAGAFIMAIYYGMGESRMRIAIDNEVSHLQVHHPKFKNDHEAKYSFPEDSLRQVMDKFNMVKSYSLRTIAPGMLANASGSQGVQVSGVDAMEEDSTRHLKGFLVEGQYFTPGEKNRILIGRKLAEKLNISVRGKIVLTLLDTADNMTVAAFRVHGIYETQNAPRDEVNVFVLKNDLDNLIGTTGRAHEAAILLKNDADLQVAYANIKEALPNLKVETWEDISPETALVINSLDTYNLVFIAIILLALSFGIVNTMLMAVLERMREIGVLMALGMSRLRLFGMILLETVLLTIAGAPLGILAAYLIIAWVGKVGIDFGAAAGDTMKNFGYAAVIYPELPLYSVGQIFLLVFIAAVLSALLPAWKAIRLQPVEAIRS
jgi:ABC-type lipoprotein release transport system permease subunit